MWRWSQRSNLNLIQAFISWPSSFERYGCCTAVCADVEHEKIKSKNKTELELTEVFTSTSAAPAASSAAIFPMLGSPPLQQRRQNGAECPTSVWTALRETIRVLTARGLQPELTLMDSHRKRKRHGTPQTSNQRQTERDVNEESRRSRLLQMMV